MEAHQGVRSILSEAHESSQTWEGNAEYIGQNYSIKLSFGQGRHFEGRTLYNPCSCPLAIKLETVDFVEI
eukprot:1160069-Pelagomonas_calceolata.AAC.2